MPFCVKRLECKEFCEGHKWCEETGDYSCLVPIEANAGSEAVVPLNDLLSANKRLVAVLEVAKDKLERYREDHSGVYLGGMEYTSLMREINAMLELNKSIERLRSGGSEL